MLVGCCVIEIGWVLLSFRLLQYCKMYPISLHTYHLQVQCSEKLSHPPRSIYIHLHFLFFLCSTKSYPGCASVLLSSPLRHSVRAFFSHFYFQNSPNLLEHLAFLVDYLKQCYILNSHGGFTEIFIKFISFNIGKC